MTVATFTIDNVTHFQRMYVENTPTQETWAAKHDGASADSYNDSLSNINILVRSNGTFDWIYRAFMQFNTSSLAGTTLLSARIVGQYDAALDANWVGTPQACMYSFIPVLPLTNLANWANFGTTQKSTPISLAVGTWSDEPYVMILNDLTLINQSGTTYLGFRSLYDANNSAPGTPAVSSQMQWALAGGTTYLEVIYLPADHTRAYIID